jgi:hypothetical protein
MLMRPRTMPVGFIQPCLPIKAPRPPIGAVWLHEIKHDGFRVIARKDGARVTEKALHSLKQKHPKAVASISIGHDALRLVLRARCYGRGSSRYMEYFQDTRGRQSSRGGRQGLTASPRDSAEIRRLCRKLYLAAYALTLGRSHHPYSTEHPTLTQVTPQEAARPHMIKWGTSGLTIARSARRTSRLW